VTKRAFFIFCLLLLSATGSAAAEKRILALQSVAIAPYDQAVRGFEHTYGAEIQRLMISEQKEKNVLKKIQELRPDMVLAVGRDALLVASRIKTLPVVYAMVLNPSSLLAGEQHINGVSMNLPPEKQLRELLRVLPAVQSIGLLYDPAQTGIFVQGLREAAGKMHVNLAALEVHRSRDVPLALHRLKGKADIFWMLPDITVTTPATAESMLLFSLENKLPILTFSEKYLELGAMLTIGIDPFDIGSQAGEMAQKILSGNIGKVGQQHVDARKASISVNWEIARKLGMAIDQKAIRNNRSNR